MPRQPKNHPCPQCRRWFTAKRIGNHVQQCTRWDRAPLPESDSDGPWHQDPLNIDRISDSESISSVSDNSSQGEAAPPAADPMPPPFFDLPEPFEAMDVDKDPENVFPDIDERVYDSDNDEEWWNTFVVPEAEGVLTVDDEGLEELDNLLNWIDNDFDLEVAQNLRNFLTAEDKQNIRIFAMRYRHNITNLLYYDLREQFQDEIQILTSFLLQKRVLKLAGWKPNQFDRCNNSCIAYTGPFAQLKACPHCKTPRHDEKGQAAQYYTLPLAPQLSALYASTGDARKAMQYTAEMLDSYDPSKIRDIHDVSAVRSLLGKTVVVKDRAQKHRYFEDKRDIPLGMMTDGFQCFKRARRGKASAWPVIIINYGRPCTERMRIENIVPFALIPGPNQPKDFNSFLFPLKTDLDNLATGVLAYDSIPDELFLLHAYLIVGIGDMQAVKHFSCMKGPGAVRPCRLCYIKGIWNPGRRKYYVPLRIPADFDPDTRRSYTPVTLPSRSTPQILRQLQRIREEPRLTARDNLAKEFGINGESILHSMPGFNRILGYPHEYMHLLFENIIPMLICLWKGNYRDVDMLEQPYVISDANWEVIGRLTAESNRSIPACFGRTIPNIYTDQNLFTAEAYSFWFVHMAPSLLLERFPDERYYRHTMLLIKIIEKCFQFEITHDEIGVLEYNIGLWVQKFEKYYYQYDMNRLQVCTLPVHALLHVPADIRATGPASCCWSWVMERFCGLLGIVARKGRRYPNAVIQNRIHQHSLVLFFDAQYDLGLRRLFRAGRAVDQLDESIPGRIPGTDLLLSVPVPKGFIPDPATRRQIATFFPILATRYVRIVDFERILPASMGKWRKLQILEGGDRIRSLDTDSADSEEGTRDNSFVRYTLFPDRNQDDSAAEDEPVAEVQYGRLKYIVSFELPAFPRAGNEFNGPKAYHLACIQPCRTVNPGDATEGLVKMTGMKDTPKFVQVGVIECAVGRVKSQGGWYIIDRSDEWARTVFIPADEEEQ